MRDGANGLQIEKARDARGLGVHESCGVEYWKVHDYLAAGAGSRRRPSGADGVRASAWVVDLVAEQ